MFKGIISVLKDISANIYFLSQDVKRLKSTESPYLVQVTTKFGTIKSLPLFTLTEVNDFINNLLISDNIISINITPLLFDRK